MTQTDTILSNGKWFSQGEGIDFDVILSMRNIKRFSSFKTMFDKMNIAEHQYFMSLLIPRYCDYMAIQFHDGKFKDHYEDTNFRYHLTMAVLTHDIEEIVTNDIPSPVKIEGMSEIKDSIRKKFRNYLNLSEDFESSDSIKMGIKHLDKICAFIEIVEYHLDKTSNIKEILDYYVKILVDYNLLSFVLLLSNRYSKLYEKHYVKD